MVESMILASFKLEVLKEDFTLLVWYCSPTFILQFVFQQRQHWQIWQSQFNWFFFFSLYTYHVHIIFNSIRICMYLCEYIEIYFPRIFISFFEWFDFLSIDLYFRFVLSVCTFCLYFTFSLFFADQCACTYIPPMTPPSWLYYLPSSWILGNGRHSPPI